MNRIVAIVEQLELLLLILVPVTPAALSFAVIGVPV
jgi:hypothetical protein